MLVLSRNKLKACLVCAAKADTRYYLNGVYLEKTPDGMLHYVSTDGHRLFAGRVQKPHWAGREPDGLWSMIIPRDVVERVTKGRHSTDAIELKPYGAKSYTLEDVIFTPVEGKFPDWRRVIPRIDAAREESHAMFNWSYLTDADKALAAWYDVKKHNGYVYMYGDESGLVTGLDSEAFVVVMPLPQAGFTGPRIPFTPSPTRDDDRVSLTALYEQYDEYAYGLLESGATPLGFDDWVVQAYFTLEEQAAMAA